MSLVSLTSKRSTQDAQSAPLQDKQPEKCVQLRRFSTILATFADMLAIGCAGLLFSLLRRHSTTWTATDLLIVLTQYSLTFVLFSRIYGLDNQDAHLLEIQRTARILQASAYSLLIVSLGIYLEHFKIGLWQVLGVWSLSTASLLIEKHLLRRPLARWIASNKTLRRALIIGSDGEARRVYSLLLNSPAFGILPVAFLDQSARAVSRFVYGHDYHFRDPAEVHRGTLTRDLLQELQITNIFIADRRLATKDLQGIEALAQEMGIENSVVSSAISSRVGKVPSMVMLDGLSIESFDSDEGDRIEYQILKKTFDKVLAAVLLLLTAPVWLLIALAIRLDSSGSILFRQERIGQAGTVFPMFKFRSMYADSPKFERSPESASDQRITRVGRYLRKSSLDELPQLLNVLRGEMSLVGPRPEMPYVVANYDARVRERLTVPQGVTGMWQLSADRRYAIHETVEYDLYYIRHRGFFLDIAILLHTAIFAAKGI